MKIDNYLLTEKKETVAMIFKKISKTLMPNQKDLQKIDSSIDDGNEIDEIMFKKGEYIGGIASVILELVSRYPNIRI